MNGGVRATLDMRDTTIGITLSNRNMAMDITNSSISDSSGNLLFYTNGIYIANSLDDTLANSTDFNPGYLSDSWSSNGLPVSQGTLVLPYPEMPGFYYLFHESGDVAFSSIQPLSLKYSIIDMNRNNGLGEVIQKSISLLDDTLYLGELNAVKHANGRDWWLVCHRYESNLYYTFLVTNDSIIGPHSQSIGSVLTNGGDGQCVFSPDGRKLARYNSENTLDVLDFDRCSGLFYNAESTFINDSAACGGVCFSPDSRLLYVGSTNYVYQFNTDSVNFIDQRNVVATWDGFYSPFSPLATNFYKLLLAPNDRIYIISCNSTDYLHEIVSPNDTGVSCNLIQHSIQLPSPNAFSLPNYPFYNLGPVIGSVCDSLINSIQDPKIEKLNFEVYPNPFSKTLTIRSISSKNFELKIYNILGDILLTRKFRDSIQLDLSFLSDGAYQLELVSEIGVVMKRIVKAE